MTLSRRELLGIFLGAPLALATCRKAPPPKLQGQIVGTSFARGHLLRDASRVEPTRWYNKDVVIVGAGPAGLAAAWRLKKHVTDFEVLELEPSAGGTSRYGTTDVVAHPWGAHYVNTPMLQNRAMISLLSEMGVVEGRDRNEELIIGEQFLCREPDERVFYRGRWYEGLYLHAGASAHDLDELARFEKLIDAWADFRDAKGRRAFAIPMATGSDDEHVTGLDKITMAEWMQKNQLSSPRLLWLIDYACRDDYGTKAAETSAWAGLFYFVARKRNAGSETQPVITWPEGNGRLVKHLGQQISIKTDVLVAQVRPTKEGVDIIAFGKDNTPFGIRCKRAILAVPQFIAARLVAGREPTRFHYGTWMVSNLQLSDRPKGRGFPMSWDNVIYDSPSLGYVVATHQRGLDRGPTVLTHYFPMCDTTARSTLLGLDHEHCADIVLADMRKAHPDIGDLTTRLDVMRWGHAMVRPSPGFEFGGERAKAANPVQGIHFAHSDLSGIALFEEALYRGISAAEAVLGELGRKTESIL